MDPNSGDSPQTSRSSTVKTRSLHHAHSAPLLAAARSRASSLSNGPEGVRTLTVEPALQPQKLNIFKWSNSNSNQDEEESFVYAPTAHIPRTPTKRANTHSLHLNLANGVQPANSSALTSPLLNPFAPQQPHHPTVAQFFQSTSSDNFSAASAALSPEDPRLRTKRSADLKQLVRPKSSASLAMQQPPNTAALPPQQPHYLPSTTYGTMPGVPLHRYSLPPSSDSASTSSNDSGPTSRRSYHPHHQAHADRAPTPTFGAPASPATTRHSTVSTNSNSSSNVDAYIAQQFMIQQQQLQLQNAQRTMGIPHHSQQPGRLQTQGCSMLSSPAASSSSSSQQMYQPPYLTQQQLLMLQTTDLNSIPGLAQHRGYVLHNPNYSSPRRSSFVDPNATPTESSYLLGKPSVHEEGLAHDWKPRSSSRFSSLGQRVFTTSSQNGGRRKSNVLGRGATAPGGAVVGAAVFVCVLILGALALAFVTLRPLTDVKIVHIGAVALKHGVGVHVRMDVSATNRNVVWAGIQNGFVEVSSAPSLNGTGGPEFGKAILKGSFEKFEGVGLFAPMRRGEASVGLGDIDGVQEGWVVVKGWLGGGVVGGRIGVCGAAEAATGKWVAECGDIGGDDGQDGRDGLWWWWKFCRVVHEWWGLVDSWLVDLWHRLHGE
ncbi:hypothetical protein BJ742DRAFT_67286 [Cladochytrium replicatum]|nr:hypothetical protein BJ742DRAFT_67286 [Cladochytrium replicatum]